MTCAFCNRPIPSCAVAWAWDGDFYHANEDESGNAAPHLHQSCWGHSAKGTLTLGEYVNQLEERQWMDWN
jgi:hypothetical protein